MTADDLQEPRTRRTDVEYIRRLVDDELALALGAVGAVLIEGPKAVGKTSTALQHARTVVRLDDDDDPLVIDALESDPGRLLKGESPVLLDEWQSVASIWNRVRREVDARGGRPGQFILTGSATPDDDTRRHSGAGRFWVLQMRTLSLFESGHSSGEVSLADLFEGKVPDGFDARWSEPTARAEIAERIVVGGWPANHGLDVEAARRNNVQYLNAIREYDLRRGDGSRRDPDVAARVVRSIARNIAVPATQATLARDTVPGSGDAGVDATSRDALRDHLAALARLRIVEDQPAWRPALRSSHRLRQTPKRHFVDPCLAAAALGAAPGRLVSDPMTLGLWFESLAVRDVRVYCQAAGAQVLYYRDDKELEVDIVVEMPDGRWGAFEVKLGSTTRAVDTAAKNLVLLRDRVGADRCAFLGVITGGARAFRRADGIDVVPLRMLGP